MGTDEYGAQDRQLADRFFDVSMVPSLMVDLAARRIVRVNQAALDLLGLPENDVIGRSGADFLIVPSVDNTLWLRSRRGERTRALREIATAVGPRSVEVRMTPSGIDEIAFVQAIDVTDQLELMEQQEEEAHIAQERAELLESFATRLTHDLRGPLSVIVGYAEALEQFDDGSDPRHGEMLARVSASANALADLAASVLAEARTSPGAASVAGSTLADDLFVAIDAIVGVQLLEAGGRLVTRSSRETLPVRVGALTQPVLNLVGNAINYRDRNRRLVVDLSIEDDGDDVLVVVSDNGRGIGDADVADLLSPGVRGSDVEEVPGSGLGLAFVQAAIDAMGGTFTLAPLELGVRATIRLPIQSRVDAADEPAGRRAFAPLVGARQLDRVLDASPIATIVLDLDQRRILRVNRATEQLLGRPRDQIVGKSGASFFERGLDADTLRDGVLEHAGSTAVAEVVLRTAGGPVTATVLLGGVPDSTLFVAQMVRDEDLVHGLRPVADRPS